MTAKFRNIWEVEDDIYVFKAKKQVQRWKTKRVIKGNVRDDHHKVMSSHWSVF